MSLTTKSVALWKNIEVVVLGQTKRKKQSCDNKICCYFLASVTDHFVDWSIELETGSVAADVARFLR